MPRRPDLLCAGDCGRLLWRGSGSLEQPTCRECRRRASQVPNATCDWCGEPFRARSRSSRFCSLTCNGSAYSAAAAELRATRPKLATHHSRRAELARTAPGLSYRQRLRLLGRWVSRGVLCTYCQTSPADTVDHVVPLTLGGTNYEGNLAPACRTCNSRKSSLLVIEFRRRRGVLPCLPVPVQGAA